MLYIDKEVFDEGVSKILSFANATPYDIENWVIEIESISGAKRMILTLKNEVSYEYYLCDSECKATHDIKRVE